MIIIRACSDYFDERDDNQDCFHCYRDDSDDGDDDDGGDDGDGDDGPNGRIPVEALVGRGRKEGRDMKIKWMGGRGSFKAMRGGGNGGY